MYWSGCLVALGVLLSAFCPRVADSAVAVCDFRAQCVVGKPESDTLSFDLANEDEALIRCCVEEQAAFYFFIGHGCQPCPLKIQTLSATPLTPSSVSVGSASDVLVALRCTVGGPNVSLASDVTPPTWLPPSVPYATIDSADSGLIRLEAARVTEDLKLECELNGPEGSSSREEVMFSLVDSLFGSEALDKELPSGGNVMLECPIPDLPDHNVTWYQSSSGIMQLPSNTVSEVGLYFCESTDARGQFVSNYISVYRPGDTTSTALTFSEQLPNEVLSVPGSNVALTCTPQGSSEVEWLYNGDLINGANGNTYTVINLTESTSGYYQCRIGGEARGSIVSSSYVHTAGVSISGESCALRGGRHELVCSFEYPVEETDFRWRLNGMEVLPDVRRSVSVSRSDGVSESRLVIDPVEEIGGDGGDYTCEVRVFGIDDVLTSAPFQVTLVGTPTEPRNIRVSMVTRASVTLNWDPPVDTGNLEIEEYYILWFNDPEDTTEATVSGELEFVITGLETFTVYRVELVANNGKYNSTPAVMNFTSGEDTPLNPPRNLSARPIHANEMQLQWEEPAPPLRGEIVEYIVTYRLEGSNGPNNTQSGADTVAIVDGLMPNTMYEFFVEAATSAGSGPQVGPVAHTTLNIVMRMGPSTPSLMKALSTTVEVMLPPLEPTVGNLSHFWLVVVRLPCPGSISGSPDDMFPYDTLFASYDGHSEGEAYIAAEIDAQTLDAQVSTPFVFGDETHEIALMNEVDQYRNGPLQSEACYTFFLRGFLSVPMANQARRKRDVQARQYRTFVSSDFMTPVETLPVERLLQIRFFSVDSCAAWTNDDTATKIDALKDDVAGVIDDVCDCDFNTSDILEATFSCMNPESGNGEAVVLRMRVQEKNGFGAPDAVMAVSDWKDYSPPITISSVQYTVSSSCLTELASTDDPVCGPLPSSTDSQTVVIAASVSAGTLSVTVVLVLAILIVGMIVWMCRRSKGNQYDTDERDKTGEEQEVQSQNGVVITNPPEPDGLSGGLRPKVPGGSSLELPAEGYNYYAPYPYRPAHSTSMASLHSARGISPFRQPMPPMPPGFVPPPMGMPMWHPHHLHLHQRTASGGVEIENGSFPYGSPTHSRQPSDATTDGRERRLPEYPYYYPYQYSYMLPQYHPMYGSPLAPRKVSTMDGELDTFHENQSSEYSMHIPKRPHTADLLEREVPRGVSPALMYPFYHHHPQESDVSHVTSASEQPMIYPFHQRDPKMARGYYLAPARLGNGALGEPSDGKASMAQFVDSQLEQNRMQNVRVAMSGSEGNEIRSDASEASSNSGVKLANSVTSEMGKSVQSFESEVL